MLAQHGSPTDCSSRRVIQIVWESFRERMKDAQLQSPTNVDQSSTRKLSLGTCLVDTRNRDQTFG